MIDRGNWRVVSAVLAGLVLQLGTAGAAGPLRSAVPRGPLLPEEQAQIELFERASASVVVVLGAAPTSSLFALAGENGASRDSKTGTGFLWDEIGHVVTNNHVVANTRSVTVRLASSETVKAELVGAAPAYDLAVLRIVGVRGPVPPPIALGTSADLRVGQFVFAIGNPFGLDQTLTTGIVSALKRRLPTSGGRELADAIQTDAAINPGNSGGPLLDSAGRLVGVTSAIFSPSGANAGIGFAIPVDVVNRIVPQLIANGRVPTPGIGIVAVSESTAGRLGLSGVVISQVVRGSPAEKAGLRGVDIRSGAIGDVIVGANGRPVVRLGDLNEALASVEIGQKVDLAVIRGNKTVTVQSVVADVGDGRVN
ncbi:MAG: trypsin-like peptidase domain-containing protein [Bauldia sp.]